MLYCVWSSQHSSVMGTVDFNNITIMEVRELSNRRIGMDPVSQSYSMFFLLHSILYLTPTILSISNRMKGMESYSDTSKFTIENVTFYT